MRIQDFVDRRLREYCFFFFFSSRRRHTRLQGDWSSDVCSSDLPQGIPSRGANSACPGLGSRTEFFSHDSQGILKTRSEEHTSELQSPCNLVCRLLLGSEEHTSELQSPCNLVCRLLLESKKQTSELQSPCNLVCRLLLE